MIALGNCRLPCTLNSLHINKHWLSYRALPRSCAPILRFGKLHSNATGTSTSSTPESDRETDALSLSSPSTLLRVSFVYLRCSFSCCPFSPSCTPDSLVTGCRLAISSTNRIATILLARYSCPFSLDLSLDHSVLRRRISTIFRNTWYIYMYIYKYIYINIYTRY